MKTPTTRKSALALALALVAGMAQAEDGGSAPGSSHTSTSMLTLSAERSDVSVSDLVWTGGGTLGAEANASASSSQATTSNGSANVGNSPNTATLESEAGKNANGNIGINVTAGVGNLQGNAVAIVSTEASDVFASATTNVSQNTLTNFSVNLDNSPNSATMDAALAGAVGNIGVNISAGAGNVQTNQLSMIEAPLTRAGRASAVIDQNTSGNTGTNRAEYRNADSANTASIMAGALAGATGNISVNIAAGIGNAQVNAMSVVVVAKQ